MSSVQRFAELTPGDPLPRFIDAGGKSQRLAWDAMAGRYLLFCLFLTVEDPLGRTALEALRRERARFSPDGVSAVAVGLRPEEAVARGLKDQGEGVSILWDEAGILGGLLGVMPLGTLTPGEALTAHPAWILVDPTLHVLAVVPFELDDPEHRAIFRLVEALPPPGRFGGGSVVPPVLSLPNVLGPELRRELIALHQAEGGADSRVVLDGDWRLDAKVKRRTDCLVSDEGVLRRVGERIARCVMPEVEKLYFMRLGHFDRAIVSAYAADQGGHYWPHRDIASPRTAHRRFALSVNLDDDFEGGALHFPEYLGARVSAPAGWAMVFPCATLHGVTPVTRGVRHVFLAFLFDDEGARIKAANTEAPD